MLRVEVEDSENQDNASHFMNGSNTDLNNPGYPFYVYALPPEKIRWFYKKDKRILPFCGNDSLRLETKYRELASQSKVAKISKNEKILVRGDLFEVDVMERKGSPIYWIESEDQDQTFSIIRGTWFKRNTNQPLLNEQLADEIETEHLKLFGEPVNVNKRKRNEKVSMISKQLKKLHIISHTITINDYHVEWFGQDTVYCYQESTTHYIRSKLGFSKIGNRLIRGYPTDAEIDDKIPDIGHIVFVVHGIGQKMKGGGDIVCQTNKIRTLCRQIAQKNYSHLFSPNSTDKDNSVNDGASKSKNNHFKNKRVEFLPIEWRKCLKLDGNTINLITPQSNKSIRDILNSTALDILYYSSPIYRPEMIESLRFELTRIYSMFCSRSPYFEQNGGRVSVLGHSLGSVLLYDILTNWNPARIYQSMESISKLNIQDTRILKISRKMRELEIAKNKVKQLELQYLKECEEINTRQGTLPFKRANFPNNFIHGTLWKHLPKLDCFFCVGSPLPVFLSLRGIKPDQISWSKTLLESNVCERFFNIFHPADPLVYRIEPLLNSKFFDIDPVRISRLGELPKILSDSSMVTLQSVPTNSADILDKKSDLSSEDTSSKPNDSIPTVGFMDKMGSMFNKWRYSSPANQMSVSSPDVDKELENRNNVEIKRSRLSINDTIFTNNKSNNELRTHRKRALSLFTINHYSKPPRRMSMNLIDMGVSDDISTSLWSNRNSHNHRKSEIVTSDPDYSESQMEMLLKRYDYILPMGRYELNLISFITAHTSYWTNPDLGAFMLSQIFGAPSE